MAHFPAPSSNPFPVGPVFKLPPSWGEDGVCVRWAVYFVPFHISSFMHIAHYHHDMTKSLPPLQDWIFRHLDMTNPSSQCWSACRPLTALECMRATYCAGHLWLRATYRACWSQYIDPWTRPNPSSQCWMGLGQFQRSQDRYSNIFLNFA